MTRVGLGPRDTPLRPRVGLGPRDIPRRPRVGLRPRDIPRRPRVGLGLRDGERLLIFAGLAALDASRRVGLGLRDTPRRPRVGLGAFDIERRRVGLGALDTERLRVGLGALDIERRVKDGWRDIERRREGLRLIDRPPSGSSISTPRMSYCLRVVDLNAATAIVAAATPSFFLFHCAMLAKFFTSHTNLFTTRNDWIRSNP